MCASAAANLAVMPAQEGHWANVEQECKMNEWKQWTK